MKVYILKENIYNFECADPSSNIIGVYKNIWHAEEERQQMISNNVNNHGFVRDEQKSNNILGIETIFYNYQENWKNYIEYEIIEKEVL